MAAVTAGLSLPYSSGPPKAGNNAFPAHDAVADGQGKGYVSGKAGRTVHTSDGGEQY